MKRTWSTRRFGWQLLAILLLLSPLTGLAEFPRDITESEWAVLPGYCPDRMKYGGEGNEGPKAPYWISVMGGRQNWSPIHHYCWALINFLRAEKASTPAARRQFLLSDSLGDYDFVIRNARPDFKLLPEIFTKMASVLVKLRKYDDAAVAFRKAVYAKPDYWPAYAGLAELYRSKGQLNEARTVVEEGLEHSPQSKLLNSMLMELQKSGAKALPRKQESAQNKEPSKMPEPPRQNDPPPQESPQQDQPQQQDPSLTK